MNMPSTPYPLMWPAGWPRTDWRKRRKAAFSRHGQPLTVYSALERLQQQLDLLGARNVVLSTNMETRLDGRPRSGVTPLNNDPGVALYFLLRGRSTCMPSDSFDTVADNIGALANHIDAVRRIERYGVGSVEQMFTGFQAIRGPGHKPWCEVLGIKPDERVTCDSIRARQRELAKKHHPDVGGSDAVMAEINAAADHAIEETSHASDSR